MPSSAIWYLRVAGGLVFQLFIVSLDIEAPFDFPLASNVNSAFGSQAIRLAAGLVQD